MTVFLPTRLLRPNESRDVGDSLVSSLVQKAANRVGGKAVTCKSTNSHPVHPYKNAFGASRWLGFLKATLASTILFDNNEESYCNKKRLQPCSMLSLSLAL
ncbi:hypothetical protein CCM_08465 [Cordyceps militaris CM01]|uniref:Uncharacterized protein n=1 Tax=Cordyceps militaris (strain CM01) TaxID=983644 RepID=G3JRN1_CORMM|nr:uncharacterized protein CCM_08465 [Cordyceps militaris CM01]EGX88421.1 hypothetical protein CCM_08465 [Cordyceps militaris CM01]